MSARQRHEAEAMRARYARAFDVPIDDVVELLEDEDARVFHRTDIKLPRWSLGTSERPRMRASIGEHTRGFR